jgi:hypothetical protein
MQIVKWEWHEKQRLYTGEAVSTRARRYSFGARKNASLYWIDRMVAPAGNTPATSADPGCACKDTSRAA